MRKLLAIVILGLVTATVGCSRTPEGARPPAPDAPEAPKAPEGGGILKTTCENSPEMPREVSVPELPAIPADIQGPS